MALRLQVGQDTSAIRPIVLRMAANEACLPLKLTAIAATPDLRINVWVLGERARRPDQLLEIAINQARLDWFNFGRNYDQLLKDAANEAEGNAFAVEYAMPAQTRAVVHRVVRARAMLAMRGDATDVPGDDGQIGVPADRRRAAVPAQVHPAARRRWRRAA